MHTPPIPAGNVFLRNTRIEQLGIKADHVPGTTATSSEPRLKKVPSIHLSCLAWIIIMNVKWVAYLNIDGGFNLVSGISEERWVLRCFFILKSALYCG